ncbi:FAD-binding domain-containing protein [Rhizopogon salebrosus TDB-379]|nr:FAD-binding domain-containing protein [Rhizopogon salebrosus TDB-379]
MTVAFTGSILSGLLFGLTAASAFSNFLDAGHVLRSTVCEEIAAAVSSESVVYYNTNHKPSLAGSSQYQTDNYHWSPSGSQTSECSFEPATAQDVGIALQILGKTQTPFAIKSGGHTTNSGFSSTSGVQIAMYSFSDVVYDADAQTATVGTGLLFDDVYAALEEYGVTVVGAKATGLGVGGITLGGGYSFLGNQYGLAFDNVVAYELVLPNGTVADITSSTNPDLFFGLRGGFNNFGIVTRVTLKTYSQSQVWGGTISYLQDQCEAVNLAIANFWSNVSDPKATLYHTYNYIAGAPGMSIILFYDAPTRPEGMFDDFLSIPHTYNDASTRPYSTLVRCFPLNAPSGFRSAFHNMAVEEITVPVLNMIANETLFWGAELANSSAVAVSYDVDPYLPGLYGHTDTPSAYPPSRSQTYSIIVIYYGWTDSSYDNTMVDAIYESVKHMIQVLTDAKQDVANVAVYPNSAPPGMPLENMYGDNLPRLRAIKNAVDPDNVMGLTGGWKF